MITLHAVDYAFYQFKVLKYFKLNLNSFTIDLSSIDNTKQVITHFVIRPRKQTKPIQFQQTLIVISHA